VIFSTFQLWKFSLDHQKKFSNRAFNLLALETGYHRFKIYYILSLIPFHNMDNLL